MELLDKHHEYWRRNLSLTAVLLLIWFVITFVLGYFAVALAQFSILGFPFSFYMAAQGSLAIYVILIWVYARRMGRLDREYDVAEGEE